MSNDPSGFCFSAAASASRLFIELAPALAAIFYVLSLATALEANFSALERDLLHDWRDGAYNPMEQANTHRCTSRNINSGHDPRAISAARRRH
jgi:hypothetical protein